MQRMRPNESTWMPRPMLCLVGGLAALGAVAVLSDSQFLPENRAGLFQKLMDVRRSFSEGRLATTTEASQQSAIVRSGLAFLLWLCEERLLRLGRAWGAVEAGCPRDDVGEQSPSCPGRPVPSVVYVACRPRSSPARGVKDSPPC